MSSLYCQFYCEENVWHLCAHPRVAAADRRVLVVSNPSKRVAMWGQRAAPCPEVPIAWDYHVVLLFRDPGRPWQVWDLDNLEPDPRPATRWVRDSFRSDALLPPIYAPRFRLLSCADYRRHLRSDRRHMLDAEGNPKRRPPPWPAIIGEPPACAPEDDGDNLERFLDTEDPGFLGKLFDLPGFERWLAEQHRRPARA